jgi:hypothetical protein
MPEWSIGLIALGFVVGITAFILWRKSAKKKADAWKKGAFDRSQAIIDSSDPITTPAGEKMYKEEGVTNLNPDANDEGIEETFKKCECAGYPVDRTRHDVTTIIFKSEPDSQGDPCYREFIGTQNPYFNSEWDKMQGHGEEVDHYILVAGQTITAGHPFGDRIVIPEHTSAQKAHQALVTSFEMEHVTLAYYDGPKFEDTKYHLTGGHPLIPDCVEGLRKVSDRYHAASWTEHKKDVLGFVTEEIYTCALLTK